MILIDQFNFEEKVKNREGLILVCFWAAWCGVCIDYLDLIEELSQEFSDIDVGKINADENVELASKNNIYVFPTILVYNNGNQIKKILSCLSKDELRNEFENL